MRGYASGTWLEGASPSLELGLGREGRVKVPNGSNGALFMFQIRNATESEARTPFGLIKGHAYSVTGIDQVGDVNPCGQGIGIASVMLVPCTYLVRHIIYIFSF